MTAGKRRVYRALQPLAYALAWLLFRPKVAGCDNIPAQGGVLVVANHPSYLDPVLLAIVAPRPFSFVAKRPLFSLPIVRTFLWLTACVPVEQDAPDRRALRLSVQKLRAGDALVIFPEGTRSDHGNLRPFQLGPALIALEAQVPIVPCGLAGFHDAWPMNAPLPSPAPVAIMFGEPFQPPANLAAPTREVARLLTEQMHHAVAQLMEQAERWLKKR
ncbi:1-acyl-sn-glycerol-3-phosphate acyltransferase [bacterium HR17]|uniref:1-acyl-sn-glycerol-3-phosphate acyltransferase n=1 Tax=Candidatus Fervidibacter japonicus TaxID=2035412 RepID=A0A2H5XGI4_9BACT|nr:1-acyl-sn-glycerol-3-phosphate acyltransferase [bacterium HR17]